MLQATWLWKPRPWTGSAGASSTCSVAHVTSANLFESILADQEQHIDYHETQLGLIDKLAEPLYLAQLVEQPSG